MDLAMENPVTRHTSSIGRWLPCRRIRGPCTNIVGFATLVILFLCVSENPVWKSLFHIETTSQNESIIQTNTARGVPDLRTSSMDAKMDDILTTNDAMLGNSVTQNVSRNTLPGRVEYPEEELAAMVDEIRSSKSYLRAPSQKARLGYKGDYAEKDYSQYKQGTFVEEALGQMENGFFVECGAADGITLSNTLMLERKRKWTGLLVEANADLYNRLLAADRNAYSANVCLSPTIHSEVLTFRPAEFRGGLVERMNENQLELTKTRSGDQVSAQCFPLFVLLCALNRTKVDYFSLDIEGAELDVLRTIPFDKIRFEVFSIEYKLPAHKSARTDAEGSVAKLHKIRDFFRAVGQYEEIGILPPAGHKNEAYGLDVIFKHV